MPIKHSELNFERERKSERVRESPPVSHSHAETERTCALVS